MTRQEAIKKLGVKLKTARVNLDIWDKTMADVLGISPEDYLEKESALFSGEMKFSPDQARNIIKLFRLKYNSQARLAIEGETVEYPLMLTECVIKGGKLSEMNIITYLPKHLLDAILALKRAYEG